MIRRLLPTFLHYFTGSPRYLPEIKWSKESWTHNLFRVYELIFWRKVGIRAESSTNVTEENGKIITRVELFTFEAVCAHLETIIRNLFKTRWIDIKLVDFRLALPTNTSQLRIPIVNFAIAHDADAVSASSATSPTTWSHTVTGSNPLIAIGFAAYGLSQATVTAASYNSVSATKAQGNQNNAIGSFVESSVWLLGGAATGAHTVSATITLGTSPAGAGQSTSYSGAQSSSTKDASNGLTGTATGTQSFNVTTVSDNCWVYAVGINVASISPTLAATQTSRGTVTLSSTSASIMRGEDTNAVKTPAGAQAMGFTIGGTSVQVWAMSGASFAPTATATTGITFITSRPAWRP